VKGPHFIVQFPPLLREDLCRPTVPAEIGFSRSLKALVPLNSLLDCQLAQFEVFLGERGASLNPMGRGAGGNGFLPRKRERLLFVEHWALQA